MSHDRLQTLSSPTAWRALSQIQLLATDMDGTITQCGHFKPQLLEDLERLRKLGITTVLTTGRSVGWVSGLFEYLPWDFAIAENGGAYFSRANPQAVSLMAMPNDHRARLKLQFDRLRVAYPRLKEADDNLYRMTDWTFELTHLAQGDLHRIEENCRNHGWDFTYSTIQGHICLRDQDKGRALVHILKQHCLDIPHSQILTVGDSPNDESMFHPATFQNSVGVANLRDYCDTMGHWPRFLTEKSEGLGFRELVDSLVQSRQSS